MIFIKLLVEAKTKVSLVRVVPKLTRYQFSQALTKHIDDVIETDTVGA